MNDNKDFMLPEELQELKKQIESLAGTEAVTVRSQKNTAEGSRGENRLFQELLEEERSIHENGSYIRITDDFMEAWIYLVPPRKSLEDNTQDTYSPEEMTDFMKREGIKNGILQDKLEELAGKGTYDQEILIARGEPAVHGKDGYYEYKFNPEQYKTPKLLENGSVDYSSMSTLQNVREGDVVAVYHPAENGQDGLDVLGNRILAKSGKDKTPLRGQSVYTDGDPNIYLAGKSGKIELKNGRIDIQSVHEIREDVTLITGKIEFFGDVIIHGNVEAGVIIRAGRNIEVTGTVEAANLYAGGDIVLTRGIQGNQKAKVSARGNMFADFIEHTVVVIGGNVQANTILNSRVSAEGMVILTGRKGAIIGGYTHGMLGIAATEIGNAAEVRTIVHAGCERDSYYKAQDARSKEIALKKQLKEIAEEMQDLLRKRKINGGRLTKHLEARLGNLEKKVLEIREEMQQVADIIQEYELKNAKGQFAEILARGNIYRGTVVSLTQMQIPVEHTTCYMKYFQQRGMIESTVIPYT